MREQLTRKDVEKIEQEIEHRKLVVRKEAIEAVKEARAQGDLSENFEYYAAKKHKNQNESRIRYLERMLKTASIVSDASRSDEVGMDDIVEVLFEEDNEVEKYKLVTSIRGNSMENRIRTTPISASIGENDVGLKSRIIKLSLWIPVRLKIHEVTVVPILAPMMIPTTWDSFMIPEFTKPTTITVVAEDDWITAVTPIPRRTALMGLEVSVSRIRSSFPPATFASPSPIKFIP